MNFNVTAKQACCVCGGGTSVGNVTDNWTGNTTGSIIDHTARQLFENVLNYIYPQPEEDKLEWQK